MRTRATLSVAMILAVAALATQAASPATPKTVICGQINHGPHATYVFQLNSKKLTGTTWTVFSTGVPCSVAMGTTPAILKWWAHAKVEAHDFSKNGLSCNKEADIHGSSGTVGCSYTKFPNNIELMMTGTYTVPQLKQMFFISG